MLTSVALLVCQVSVVDCPGSTVFGLADKDAVGEFGAGGGGGGGGATFLWHPARKTIATRVKTTVTHLAVVNVFDPAIGGNVVCCTDSSFLCAHVVASVCSVTVGRTLGPAAKIAFLDKLISAVSLQRLRALPSRCSCRVSTSNSNWAECLSL
jgi:hypothetical protein